MAISEETCISCCEKVRDLNFWVGNQHTGRCFQGCEGSYCGSGYACLVGTTFLAGDIPPSQEDGTGTIRTYKCLGDGSVRDLKLITTSPTLFPTTSIPTTFPTKSPTPFPTRRPSISPTPFPSRRPTKSPTPFPTNPSKGPTHVPTISPSAFQTQYPTIFKPTLSPSYFPTLGHGSTQAPTQASNPIGFLSETENIFAIIIMAVIFCCICTCCCIIYCLIKLRPEKQKTHDNLKETKTVTTLKKNTLPIAAAVLERLDIDDDGKLNIKSSAALGQKLAAKARVASWKITKNIFSSEPKISHTKRDYKNQSRRSFAIPVPPQYDNDEGRFERIVSGDTVDSEANKINMFLNDKDIEVMEETYMAQFLSGKPIQKSRTDPSTNLSSTSEVDTERTDF